jgi:pSer/pThr/pTyr-binding forkhead associated (FHA) protein
MSLKKISARAIQTQKMKQAASDREAMKDFIKEIDDDSDEEEMRDWIAQQKEANKSEAEKAEERYDQQMELEREEALREAEIERQIEIERAEARMIEAKKKAEAAEKLEIDKVYAQYSNAMRKGDFQKICDMVQKVGISVNWEDSYGNTAIIVASKFGLKVPINKLLYLGADINQENQYGQTPLIEACKGGFGNIVQHLLLDPANPNELRAVANAKNKFNKTAADYAIKAGHGKKILPLLNASIELRLQGEKQMGFTVDEDAFESAVDFNIKDQPRLEMLKKRRKELRGTAFSRLRKTLGLESKAAIERLHQLREESAIRIQGAIRTMWAKAEMSNRMREIVIAAHRKMLMEKKKNLFIVRIQRGYRLKLARRYWRKRIIEYKAASKMNNLVRMFVQRCYYLRHLETIAAMKRVDQAATMIQCQARRMKAVLILSMLKKRYNASVKICRFSKIVAAKRKARHQRWEKERKAVLDNLYKTAIEIKYVVIFDELKDELVAIKVIQKWAKALLFNWSTRIDWNVIKQLRTLAATKIQNCARKWKSRKVLKVLQLKRKKHLKGLPSVLSITKLQGSGNHAYRVGSQHKYGYCGTCECEKFRPPDPMKPLMCGCGHFITRHVIGYFRDPRQIDYYEPAKSRRKLMGRKFSAATGISENFEIVMKMKPKDLRKSLASTQSAPPAVTGGENLRDPGEAARAQFLLETAALKKRKERAKRAKLFDPIRKVGIVVSTMERKNPIMKKKREKAAKLKIAKTMARDKQLEMWRSQAEDFTGKRVSTAEFNRVRDEYVKRDEAGLSLASPKNKTGKPKNKTSKHNSPATVSGAVLWRIPGEVPLMEPSSGSPSKRVNHTLTLIEQLEKEIDQTKRKAEIHRSNIIRIKKEEKRARKEARKAKLEYEKSATILLLKNRLGNETEETTHDKLIKVHIQTVDDQKKKLLEELNRISRKAYGLDDADGNAKDTVVAEEQEKEKTLKKKRGKVHSLMGDVSSSAMQKHREGKVVSKNVMNKINFKDQKNKNSPARKKVEDVEELVIVSPIIANSQRRRHNKLTKKGRRSIKRNNPAKSSSPPLDPSKVPSVPTSDMVMTALKGMLKGIERPDRTKNRWNRTPETNAKRKNLQSPYSSDDGDDEGYDNQFNDEYGEDPDFVNLNEQENKKGRGRGEREDRATPDLGEDDSFLDQRAETPLEHVAWRQSHAQRAPVIFLHLISNKYTDPPPSIKSRLSFPKVIGLKAGRTFVGRDGRSCDVMMDSTKQPKMVSKVHACFWVRRKGNKWIVECADCNSTNGTYINGKQLSSNRSRKRLNVGATILFGKRSRKEEMRSELLYVLTDDSTGIPPNFNRNRIGAEERNSSSNSGDGGDGKNRLRQREKLSMYVPPQSPLNDNRLSWGNNGESKQNIMLEELNDKGWKNDRGTHGRRNSNNGSHLDLNKLEIINGEKSQFHGTIVGGSGTVGSGNQNSSGGMYRIGDDETESQKESSIKKRLSKNSSMTNLDAGFQNRGSSPSSVLRRRSSLSRERSVQQEENFTNMMVELGEASDMLRRPPTTPLRKRRSSLSRGGIRASLENPGMQSL